MKLASVLTGLTLALGLSTSSQASLLYGKEVGYNYYYPDFSSTYAAAQNGIFAVGDGVEIGNVVNNLARLDISDSNLLITFLPPPGAAFMEPEDLQGSFHFAPFNGFVIFDVFNTISDFVSVTINAATNMAGFDMSRISFDANQIWVNLQGLSYNRASSIISLNIKGRSTEVPEPASFALLGIGLLGLANVLRRRRQG